MSLIDLKHYLQQIKICSLFQLSSYFNREPDVLRSMLQHWEYKGYIKKMSKTEKCGSSCSKCDPLYTEIYQWIGPR